MWLSYVCNFCNWCVINSHEQNIQFLHDSLQEQSEHDFGVIYFFGDQLDYSMIFGLICDRFMLLLLCCYIHNSLTHVYMTRALTFWPQSMIDVSTQGVFSSLILCLQLGTSDWWVANKTNCHGFNSHINCYVYNTTKNLCDFIHIMHQHVTIFIHNIVMYITVAEVRQHDTRQ